MADSGKLMAGKRGVVIGVANNRSIAWGIAKAVAAQGAEVALTYQGDASRSGSSRWRRRWAPSWCCPAT